MPATPSTSPVRILEVSLTKKAPLGSMETQVVVLTGDRKRLVLPVLATIDRVP